MIYFTTASVKYWCNFRLPSWQYGRIYGGLPRGVASSETWAPDSRFTAYTKKKCDWWTDDANAIYIWPLTITDFEIIAIFFFLKFPKTISNVIWVSSNGSYRGIFAEIEMCLRGKQFFLMIKNRTKCYEGPSKKKKQTNKNKKHPKKKLLRIITFKTIIVFSKSVSEKHKYYF